MIVICQRCRKEFEISTEKIEQIKKNFIGDITPIDFLDYFGTWSGRCGDSGEGRKKHDFIWSLDFCNDVKELIKKNRDIDGRFGAIELTLGKVNDTVNQLKQKLEEFDIKKRDVEKDKEMILKEKEDLRERVMMLTGIDDITFWESETGVSRASHAGREATGTEDKTG